MKTDKDMFFLSPKNQDRLITVMDELKRQGYSTDNRVLTLVLHAMRGKGLLPKGDKKDMLDLIKKLVPPGGRILQIKGEHYDRRGAL